MLGVFLDRDTVDRGDLDFSKLEAVLPGWHYYNVSSAADLPERLPDAEFIITNKVVLDDDAFQAAPNLKLVCVAATGTNNIDFAAAARHDVSVCNVKGYATPSVVQHCFALMLSLTTHLPQYQQDIANGAWQRSPHFCLLDHPIQELAGKTLGIVGYGELGHAVANVARAFGMNVLISQRPGSEQCPPDRIPLHDLLPQVDVLSLHCPLTPETRHLIGPEELALLGDHAILINTARGGIVDEEALASALRDGHLGGAGIDVLSQEPPIQGSPLLEPDIPNLIVTPHIAWASQQSRQRLLNEIALNIQAFLEGHNRNIVSV